MDSLHEFHPVKPPQPKATSADWFGEIIGQCGGAVFEFLPGSLALLGWVILLMIGVLWVVAFLSRRLIS
jgi:hypothetical protein